MTALCVVNGGLALAAPGEVLLVDALRGTARLTGTKLACGTGDCGACTVLVGRPGAQYRAMCACLVPMVDVHGQHVVTAEGLPDCGLQDLLIEEGAVQCGFCTPGLIMALAGCLLTGGDAAESVAGNLCRCTGGPPIRRVIERLSHLPRPALPDVTEQLRAVPLPGAGHGAVPVAGGTDVYVDRAPARDDLHLPPACEPSIRADVLRLPAATTVEQLRAALPAVSGALALFGSEQIRHRATIGGNLASGSPIGDIGVILLALDAAVVLRDALGRLRTVPLGAFWTGYRANVLAHDELIETVLVRRPAAPTAVSVEKVSRRAHVDVASVNSACVADVHGAALRHVRISAGGVAPTVVLLPRTAAALEQGPLTGRAAVRAALIAEQEVTPISDVRGSAGYKRLLLRQLILAHVERLRRGTVAPGDLP